MSGLLHLPLDTILFLALLVSVGMGRLLEMRLSRRHQRMLSEQGFEREKERGFPVMVAVHTGILLGSAIEVLLLPRPMVPELAVTAGAAFLLANMLRWWVIHTMAEHWNVQVVNTLSLGVVTTGPFRWVRHPNYVAVFVELLALPLIHSAYLTALLGAVAHVVILTRRITFEETFLHGNATYVATMGGKPRFFPLRLPLRVRAGGEQPRN